MNVEIIQTHTLFVCEVGYIIQGESELVCSTGQ